MWQTTKESEAKSGSFPAVARSEAARRPVDAELLALVDDPELYAQMQADSELAELAELTRFAEQVRSALAPARRSIELSARERAQRICNAVLRRAGALPPQAALLDEAAQDRLLEARLKEYRSSRRRGVWKLLSARLWGQRDGLESEKG